LTEAKILLGLPAFGHVQADAREPKGPSVQVVIDFSAGSD
jgi:hypothetical protein